LLLLGAPALAHAARDVALVSSVSGEVSHIGSGGVPKKARVAMLVQQGDRFAVTARGTLRVTYLADGRQETWTGPASFRAGTTKSDRIGGHDPRVESLPAAVPKSLARVPELIRSANSGKALRGAKRTRQSLVAGDQADLMAAKVIYARMRAAAVAEDVTPELYLFSVPQGYALYDELEPVVADMRRRQPRSDEIQALARSVSRP